MSNLLVEQPEEWTSKNPTQPQGREGQHFSIKGATK
jgi:hypothetical protein